MTIEIEDAAFSAMTPLLDERIDGATQEEIDRAKATCMCGASVADHDDAWLGHTPCSVWDYMQAPPDPFTDEIEGLEDSF